MNLLLTTSEHSKENLTGQEFCVYSHSLHGEIFYIGSGIEGRPYKTNRSKRWKEIVRVSQTLEVDILSWHDSKEEASLNEKRLIEELKPKANKHFNSDNLKLYERPVKKKKAKVKLTAVKRVSTRAKPVVRSDGIRFNSITEASRELGCPPYSVSRVVGKPNNSIKGYKFRYENCSPSKRYLG